MDFHRVDLKDNVEILMHTNGSQALVAWPWFADPEQVESACWRAQTMGFIDVEEVGNLLGYKIPEIDCDDWDFYLLKADA